MPENAENVKLVPSSAATVKGQEPYEQAIKAALRDLQTELQHKAQLQKDINASTHRIKELESLVESLWRALSDEGRARVTAECPAFKRRDKFQPVAGTRKYREIVTILHSEPKRSWSVNAIQNKLAELNLKPGAKLVGNVLARLAGTGQLERVRRGVYRIREYGVLVEGGDEFFSDRD